MRETCLSFCLRFLRGKASQALRSIHQPLWQVRQEKSFRIERQLPQPPIQRSWIVFGKKFGLTAYSPEQDEGHIVVMGPSGTGKTSALLIPTLRSWQGTALVVDISSDISANVDAPNKIVFDPTSDNCIPYDVFASIDTVTDETERLERLEQLAYLLLPDKSNDSEAGVFFTTNGRKMITAALICYYGMGWDFIAICEHSDNDIKPKPIIKPADLAHLGQELFVICDDGSIRLKKNFYFK